MNQDLLTAPLEPLSGWMSAYGANLQSPTHKTDSLRGRSEKLVRDGLFSGVERRRTGAVASLGAGRGAGDRAME